MAIDSATEPDPAWPASSPAARSAEGAIVVVGRPATLATRGGAASVVVADRAETGKGAGAGDDFSSGPLVWMMCRSTVGPSGRGSAAFAEGTAIDIAAIASQRCLHA